jgi:hypothetical protein
MATITKNKPNRVDQSKDFKVVYHVAQCKEATVSHETLWREQVTFNVIDCDVRFVIAPKTLNYFAFQSFNFERT